MDELTNPWVLVGLLGQACFGARFLLQWIVSEKRQESVIPIGFWYLSLGGAAIVLTYAIYRRDPVFILGQTFGFVVYARNLTLLRRKKRAEADAAGVAPPAADVAVSASPD